MVSTMRYIALLHDDDEHKKEDDGQISRLISIQGLTIP